MRKIKRFQVNIVVMLAVCACFSGQEEEKKLEETMIQQIQHENEEIDSGLTNNKQQKISTSSHYRIRYGETVENKPPLPAMTPIFIDYFTDEEKIGTRLGFRAWDFNGDKRFDQVTVLDVDGHEAQRLYDFNFDGKIDKIQRLDSP